MLGRECWRLIIADFIAERALDDDGIDQKITFSFR